MSISEHVIDDDLVVGVPTPQHLKRGDRVRINGHPDQRGWDVDYIFVSLHICWLSATDEDGKTRTATANIFMLEKIEASE